MKTTAEILREAKTASRRLAQCQTGQKKQALLAAADELIAETEAILAANAQDADAAREKLGAVMIDRLTLNEKRIRAMADGIREVAALPDPVGRTLTETTRPNGLKIEKITVPMGVIAIIYESRPNVTSDAAALALMAGSAVVLRGGRDAFRSNAAVVSALRRGIASAGLEPELIGFVEDTTREGARELMTAAGLVDLLIPRGGAGLIQSCVENARVPCIQTGTGICHIYADRDADLAIALSVIENAKTSRPSVCNAAEVLLVHRAVAPTLLPALRERLVTAREAAGLVPVELRLDEEAAAIIPGTKAGARDFDTEFLDYILAVKTVGSVEEAAEHIAAHSTGHSEAILTRNAEAAGTFAARVDSAAVYINASTRFTDGGEFGLGCEMGISTQKLHARGPMGLGELVSYKYIVRGDGQIRV